MDARGGHRRAVRSRRSIDLGNRSDAARQRHARRCRGRARGPRIPPELRQLMLRLGMDVDGVLADFRASFRTLATAELGHKGGGDVEADLSKADIERLWKAVARAPNWWADLPAYEGDQIARMYDLSRQGRWEVFFMTSRPPSAGDTVQLQTQVWLEQHGFYMPTVLTAPAGARGELARALRIDLIVDDHLVNCMEIVGASNAKVLHMARGA